MGNPSEGFFVAKLRKIEDFEGRYALQQDAEHLENTIDSLPMEAPEVMEVLEALEKTYGVSPETFRPWRFLRRKKHLNLVPAHWDKVWGGAMRNGLTLSTFSTGFWRPSHTAVQTFRKHFTKNILPLTDAQMNALITNGTTPIDSAQVDSFQSIWPLLSSEHVGGVFARGIHLEKGTIRWKKPRIYAIPGLSNDTE